MPSSRTRTRCPHVAYSLPTLLFADPDSGAAFPVPVDRLLRDPQLESLLKELHDRQTLRRIWADETRALADSISTFLAGGSRR